MPTMTLSRSSSSSFLPVHVLSHDRDSGISTEAESDADLRPPILGTVSPSAYPFSDDDESPPGTSSTPTQQPASLVDLTSNSNNTTTSLLFSSESYHNYQAEQAMYSIKQLAREDSWKKTLKHKSGVMVYMYQPPKQTTKIADSKAPIFKGETVIHGFSPQAVFYVIGMRKLWDNHFEEGRLVANLNETTSITYEAYRHSSSSKAYDVALVERIECSADGVIAFACTSIETPQLPKVPGRTRRHMKLQGWVLKPLHTTPPSTKVTYFTQENVKGWIAGLTKKSLARRPLIIADVEAYLVQKATRLKDRNPISSSATNLPSETIGDSRNRPRRPSIMNQSQQPQQHFNNSRQRSKTSTSNPHNSAAMSSSHLHPTHGILARSSPNTSSQPADSGTSSRSSSLNRRIRFADDDVSIGTNSSTNNNIDISPSTDSIPLSNTSEAASLPSVQLTAPAIGRLYPPSRHRTVRKQCLDTLKRLATDDLEEWKQLGERNSTKLYSKSVQGSALPILRGDATINARWTPEQVCSVVQSFGARKIWDEYFEKGHIVERFSQKEYLLYTQMRSMFPIHSRDFSVLTAIDSDPATGTVYVASASVTDNLIPEEKTHVRGKIHIYGWVFSPMRNERGRPSGIRVTFVCHMDLEGTAPLPPAIIRQLTMEVPSCVDRVQWYLRQHGCPPYIRRVAGKITQEIFDSKDKSYRISLIAKHNPSHHYAQRDESTKTWCTDIRTHTSMYNCGFSVHTVPETGIRVELRADSMGIRIYTEDENLDGTIIEAAIIPNPPGSATRYMWKDVSLKEEPKEAPEASIMLPRTFNDKLDAPITPNSPSQIREDGIEQCQEELGATPSLSLSSKPVTTRQRNRPVQADTEQIFPNSLHETHRKNYQKSTLETPTMTTIFPKEEFRTQNNNHMLVITDELTFTGQQLSVILLLMAACYYMGKFSCRC
ncbi:hypothetical protein BX666DRAFT_346758 [Dichotomocladium elegans]|nr:hypothetical protein BX666DRAFT_346758 [Dichotomocladium elegans]